MPNQQQQDTAPAPASNALLPPWANGQDGWCRTVTADVLKNRVQPSGVDIDRYLKLLLAEKKLSDDAFEAVPKIEERQVDGNPLDAVRIDKLKIGDGVNALRLARRLNSPPPSLSSSERTAPASPVSSAC